MTPETPSQGDRACAEKVWGCSAAELGYGSDEHAEIVAAHRLASLADKEAENQSLRQRVEELSEQIHRLKPMADLNDMWRQELDDIGRIIGCDHLEGLASCMRQTFDKAEADLAAAQADSRRLREVCEDEKNAPLRVAARRIACLASNGRGITDDEAFEYMRAELRAALSATVAAGKAEKK
jgi:hypothetical protein